MNLVDFYKAVVPTNDDLQVRANLEIFNAPSFRNLTEQDAKGLFMAAYTLGATYVAKRLLDTLVKEKESGN